MDVDRLREQYESDGIDLADLDADPMVEFGRWLDAAIAAGLSEPNAMTLATADGEGPDARVVLLKGLSPDGFVLYTNLESAKAVQLRDDPRAALCVLWQPLHRQVRVRGVCEPVDDVTADAYYAGRPRGSQLGAWASPQSRPIVDRVTLERAVAEVERRFGDDPPTRPPFWGGLRVRPWSIEFWQGRPDRLHDRIRYRRGEGGGPWERTRLAP